MLQIALAQEKTGNTSENLVNKLAKLFIHCIQHNKSLKKIHDNTKWMVYSWIQEIVKLMAHISKYLILLTKYS